MPRPQVSAYNGEREKEGEGKRKREGGRKKGRGREGKRWFVTGRRTEAQLDGKNMGVMEKSLVKASHEMYKKNTGSESKHLKIKMKKET